jgi:hypothetical protein
MATYTYVKHIDQNTLTQEMQLAGISSWISSMDVNGNILTVNTYRDLSQGEVNRIYQVVMDHNQKVPGITRTIQDAMDFGRSIIIEVGVENIVLGYNPIQIVQILTKFAGAKAALEAGSLYTAIAIMEATPPDALVPKARIEKYVNKIKAYLGV